MNDDLISRQAVLDFIDSMRELVENGRRMILQADTLPPAERKKGEWLEHYSHEDGERDGVECSKCRTHYYFGGQLMNFCPNCGAEMRGEEG